MTDCRLEYRVEFGRAADNSRHAVVKAVGAPKAKARTLCGVDRTELQIAAPHEVGRNRHLGDGTTEPADPFFNPRFQCPACASRLAV